jgi:two-component system, chemotaxis family, sensor kinase CheA
MEIGEDLWVQFRTVAIERLERIESAWSDVLGSLDERAAALILRELHTLKGESNLLGMTDVGLICNKLEDLLEVARNRGYAVDDDFDLVVSMAVRFMAVLVRKRTGSHIGGIDLPAFVRQIDSLLAELRPEPRRVAIGTLQTLKLPPSRGLVPAPLRARLAPFAVDAFIEYAMARGPRRDRLRASWHGLRDLIGIQRAIVGSAQLDKHIQGARGLARELDKYVDISVELTGVEATIDILAAITSAVVHLLRNAIDHGIEPAIERRARGKPERGKIRIRGGLVGDRLELQIDDDGQGVSLDRVHARAIELGLVTANMDVTHRWFELVCRPGFSTRTQISETSGRGVGLDAVRAAIIELGGTFTATTARNQGTCWTLSIPLQRATIEGHVFRVPGLPFPVVVDSSWTIADAPGPTPAIDLAWELGFCDTQTAEAQQYFVRGDTTFAIAAEQRPEHGSARRIVAAQPPARAEVVVIDGAEGLLLHAVTSSRAS